ARPAGASGSACRTCSLARTARPDDARVETGRRDRDLLSVRDSLLGRIRAGRLDAQSLRRSLHASRNTRLLVPLVVVPIGTTDLRRDPGAGLRVGLASP